MTKTNSHKPKTSTQNKKVKDSGARLIFGDPILCAQFLRGYTDIELLKDVRPEDIEDVTDRFISVWQEERDSDTVKKIHLKNQQDIDTLYLITLIEHQTKVDYDMSFRILRYIVLILTDYAAEAEKKQAGCTALKGFRYPPVLPIVFYDGDRNWTAAKNFQERTALSDLLGEYIPNFQYLVVPLSRYSNQELIEKEDELSLIMLIDKLRSSAEFHELAEIPDDYLEKISRDSPESLLKLIAKIIAAFLHRNGGILPCCLSILKRMTCRRREQKPGQKEKQEVKPIPYCCFYPILRRFRRHFVNGSWTKQIWNVWINGSGALPELPL